MNKSSFAYPVKNTDNRYKLIFPNNSSEDTVAGLFQLSMTLEMVKTALDCGRIFVRSEHEMEKYLNCYKFNEDVYNFISRCEIEVKLGRVSTNFQEMLKDFVEKTDYMGWRTSKEYFEDTLLEKQMESDPCFKCREDEDFDETKCKGCLFNKVSLNLKNYSE